MSHGDLEAAYRKTTFWVDHPGGKFGIRIDRTCDVLDRLLRQHGVSTWAYVTAWNPRSIELTAQENEQRNARLLEHLAPLGHPVFTGRGEADSGGWTPEESVLILGIDALVAVELGMQFGQNAVVVGSIGRAAELKWCGPGRGHR